MKFSIFNALNFLDQTCPHPPNRPYPGPTSSRGKGARPATIAAAGGDRAGLGWRGLLRRVRGLPSLGSPPAVGVDGDPARVLPIGPRPRRLESVGNDRFRVRLSLNRAAYRTLADNERAERSASSKRYTLENTPDVVRRSASLSIPSAACRVSLRSHAGEHFPR